MACAPAPTPLRRPSRRHAGKPARKAKREKHDVHGWVVLDKPVGMTSTHAVAVIKRLFQAKRAGHAGTLDPLASGLPADRARRRDQDGAVRDGRPQGLRLHGALGRGARYRRRRGPRRGDERHAARARRRSRRCCPASSAPSSRCRRAISAIKIEGERAYDIARDGEAFELEPRVVNIDRLELEEMADADHSRFHAECGKGTYVRAIARDLGRCSAATAMSRRCGEPRSGRSRRRT